MSYEFNPVVAVGLFAILVLVITIVLLITDDSPKKAELPQVDMDAEKYLKVFRQNVIETKKKKPKKKRKPRKKRM
jgi:hypothetical protein